jgi:hypothetical protein
MPRALLKVWPHRFAASVGSVFGDRNAASDGAPDAIAALVDGLRPLDRESAELLHAASHELRTPLTSVIGFTELVAEGAAGPVTEQQRRLLALVSENAARVLAMVEELAPAPPEGLGPIDGLAEPHQLHERYERHDFHNFHEHHGLHDRGAVPLPVPGPAPREDLPRGTTW